jgi:CDP-paratose 2-epimerase
MILTKVLVTGGGGFIGSHVAEFFANQNDIDEVIVIDNLSRSTLLNKKIKSLRYNWDYLHKSQKIKFYEKDICEFDFLKRVLSENAIDIIVHTAAQTAVTTSIANPIPDFKNNVVGTFNLLESIRLSKLDPCVILCSTNKVFGNNVNNCEIIENESKYSFSESFTYGIPEDFPIDLCEHTPYGTSKLCSDLYFQEYGHLYGLKTAVFRMSCIYGTTITGKKITIYGDGKQVRDILFISDLIHAFDSFIQRAKLIDHEVFCMGGGPENTLSLLELIDILKQELNTNIYYDFDEWRSSDQKVYISDIRKAKKELNWSPKISVNDGVKELINWVKLNKNLFI